MLKEITINNFAIIKQMNISFDSGLSVITGQTGAGKSIVIDAIEQLLGSRTSKDKIANNSEYAYIEGVFDVNDQIKKILIENNVFFDDDYLFISKNIKSDGKSQIKINNKMVTNEIIKNLSKELIEIHSQNSTYELLQQTNQQQYIDSFFNDQENIILDNYILTFNEYTKALKEKSNLLNQTIDSDLLSFYQEQLKVIDDNLLSEQEVEELEAQEKYYKEFKNINDLLNETISLINDDYIYNINRVSENLTNLSVFDEELNKYVTKTNDIYYELKELSNVLLNKSNNLFYDEDENEKIREQLFNFQKLMKKYSYSYETILENKESLINKIDLINNSDTILNQLENKIKENKQKIEDYAIQLNNIRKKYIDYIEVEILKYLKQLYLKDADFKIQLEECELYSLGNTKVNFMFNANIGSQLRLLKDVASGGELSRLMLALKIIKIDDNKTYIFDEVDTGVSGEVADSIGKLLKQLSKKNNVIAITHLPQVARYADNHLYIEKALDDNFMSSNAFYLNREERVNKIALMLSGDKVSDLALKHAKELLDNE